MNHAIKYACSRSLHSSPTLSETSSRTSRLARSLWARISFSSERFKELRVAENVELEAEKREGRGKNDARRLRAQGMLPAVLYGDGENAVLSIPAKVVDYTL